MKDPPLYLKFLTDLMSLFITVKPDQRSILLTDEWVINLENLLEIKK